MNETAWVVFTTGLIGLIVTIYVVAARQADPRPGPAVDDIDAELSRILADARLGEISTRPSLEESPYLSKGSKKHR